MGFDIGKVNGLNKVYKINSLEKQRAVKDIASAKSEKDELVISQKAMDLAIAAKALNKIKLSPDIEEEKVNAIRERIDSGTYDVKGIDIVKKMLS